LLGELVGHEISGLLSSVKTMSYISPLRLNFSHFWEEHRKEGPSEGHIWILISKERKKYPKLSWK